MRDSLPKSPPRLQECAVVNLDSSKNNGTHWVAYIKKNNVVEYFDSFGNLKPPKELVKYLGGKKVEIFYNNNQYQNYDQINCGHLCLKFLLQHSSNNGR